jgi:SAM-dependent methyltransferase
MLHWMARLQGNRAQALATSFLRNRPELEMIRRLVSRKEKGARLNVTVLACSTGAEAYSIAWTIKAARPDLQLTMRAVDISPKAVEHAREGVYPFGTLQLSGTKVLDGVTPEEREQIFNISGDRATVKSWIRKGIEWHVGDAGDPEITAAFGPQDLVTANNFLCHMEPPDAERCLRNIARLVAPQGYLFVSGIDLDVRTKVARDLEWEPLQELIEEIHDGDAYLRSYWPSRYGGLEPLNRKRRDWRIRYAAGFLVRDTTTDSALQSGCERAQEDPGALALAECDHVVRG